uniref:Uncharacterized protein n=1 Tax=Strombidium inclinatum TaxID=197538 RepID=A0A7S3N1B3_9SPIT
MLPQDLVAALLVGVHALVLLLDFAQLVGVDVLLVQLLQLFGLDLQLFLPQLLFVLLEAAFEDLEHSVVLDALMDLLLLALHFIGFVLHTPWGDFLLDHLRGIQILGWLLLRLRSLYVNGLALGLLKAVSLPS